MSAGNDKPLVVCLVGTDHHPFDRLVSWCDELATARPDIDVLVQHGSTAGPSVARGEAFLDKQTLGDSLSRAHVAICHGGPGLISDLRGAGLMPLVVARNPELGEHVDGHQMRFVARVAASGIVQSIESSEQLLAAVDGQLASARGSGLDASGDAARVAASVQRFAAMVEPLRRSR